MCGGAGHGIAFFFDAALFPNGYGIFFWELIGILLGYIKYRAQAVCAGLLMVCHYGYLIWQALTGAYPTDDFAKAWLYIAPVMAFTALVYVAGQALIWRRIMEGVGMRAIKCQLCRVELSLVTKLGLAASFIVKGLFLRGVPF